MKKSAHQKFHLREEQLAELKQAFDVFDTDGTGLIGVKDLRVAFRALGFEPTKHELTRLMNSVAKKNSNLAGTNQMRSVESIDFTEFVAIMIEKMSENDPREHIQAAFNMFKGSNNTIGLSDLRRVANEIGEKLTDEELLEMIKEGGKAVDGQVNEEIVDGTVFYIIRVE